uniref:Transmembrane protein n=1 Tax=Acrobeloides nanus TaxID=290746 RepID=A0A914CJ33_9BILA
MNEVNDAAFAIIIICGILLLIVVLGLLCLVMSLSFDCWWNVGYCVNDPENDEEECFLNEDEPVPKHWLVVFSRKKKNGPSHKSVIVPI